MFFLDVPYFGPVVNGSWHFRKMNIYLPTIFRCFTDLEMTILGSQFHGMMCRFKKLYQIDLCGHRCSFLCVMLKNDTVEVRDWLWLTFFHLFRNLTDTFSVLELSQLLLGPEVLFPSSKWVAFHIPTQTILFGEMIRNHIPWPVVLPRITLW